MLHYFQLKENNLDIIIPCYNPLKDWHKSIVNSYNYINNALLNTNIHIILVNDGSNNGIDDSDIQYLEENTCRVYYLHFTKTPQFKNIK